MTNGSDGIVAQMGKQGYETNVEKSQQGCSVRRASFFKIMSSATPTFLE